MGMVMNPTSEAGGSEPLTGYQLKLLFFLSVATFFEGYDLLALAQILPQLRAEFGLLPSQAGMLVSVVNVGTLLAFFMISKADLWGRRPVLAVTVIGYTVASALSGLAPNVLAFALAQLAARIFLIAEWAVATVYVAEEFPAARRGFAIGLVQASASLGSIACAGLVPIMLKTELGWRMVYFVGTIPLLILAWARRGLKETARFEAIGPRKVSSPLEPLRTFWRGPYRARMLELALIWGLTYTCTQNAMTFWKEFAMTERGFTNEQVGLSMTIAALGSLPMLFLTGKFLDRVGRRHGAVVIFLLLACGAGGAYSLETRWPLTFALLLGLFGISGVLIVLNAFTTELFPTEVRADAYAWANNILGRLTFLVSPLLVGYAAEAWGWGTAVLLTVPFVLAALGCILWLLPETKGLELEETAALDLPESLSA